MGTGLGDPGSRPNRETGFVKRTAVNHGISSGRIAVDALKVALGALKAEVGRKEAAVERARRAQLWWETWLAPPAGEKWSEWVDPRPEREDFEGEHARAIGVHRAAQATLRELRQEVGRLAVSLGTAHREDTGHEQ